MRGCRSRAHAGRSSISKFPWNQSGQHRLEVAGRRFLVYSNIREACLPSIDTTIPYKQIEIGG